MTGTTAKAGTRATYPAHKPSGMDGVCDVPEFHDVRRPIWIEGEIADMLAEVTE